MIFGMEKSIVLKNEIETRHFGAALAKEMQPNQVYALIGDLGAGKTTLAKAIARGLGVTETLTSPTFTIVQEYETGRLPLYHFDVYRLEGPDELEETGYEEFFYGSGVTLVEWAGIVRDIMPPDTVRVTIKREYIDGSSVRKITVGGRDEVVES